MADATGVAAEVEDRREGFVRGLGLLDSTMIVAGSMIGSGIFIVSSIIARQVGSPGWLLVVWIVTGLLTLMAALSYGELAAMMPRAGGLAVCRAQTAGGDATQRAAASAAAAVSFLIGEPPVV